MQKLLDKSLRLLLFTFLLFIPLAGMAQKPIDARTRATAPDVKLAHTVVRLENGLTVLMQPDQTLPEVGLEVWIRGGSREEVRGQFGAAHLFEHDLPYSGKFFSSAENRARYRQALRGGNAGTEPDFLRFYSQVTPEGLELLIAALADRLESDPKAFNAERLRRDQDIVVNELRRGMGTDWDTEIRARLHRGTFGEGHPYGHSTGGSEADVRAATVELMQDWHKRFAGASNTLVLIAGNFDPVRAEAMVRRYFGPIQPGQSAPHITQSEARPVALREIIESDIRQGKVYLRWPVPAWGTAEGDNLTLFARVLAARLKSRASGAGSPLASTRAEVELWELAGAFTMSATFGSSSAEAAQAEAVLRSELERLLGAGPSANELARAKAQLQAEFVRSLQQPAWRGGRTDVLGLGLLYRDDPDFYRTRLARFNAATPLEVALEGRKWLSVPGYTLEVLPRPLRKAVGTIDRAAAVPAPEPKPAAFPAIQEMTLSSGMRVLLAERPQLPLVQLTLAFRAGASTDESSTAGRATVALKTLTHQRVSPGGTTLADALESLGAKLETRLDEDFASLSFSVLSDRVDDAALLFAAALTQDAPEAVIRSAKTDSAQALEAALKDPLRLRERSLACAFRGSAPCNPGALDGLGTSEGLSRLSTDEVRRFYANHYKPSNAVLIASGDIKTTRLSVTLNRALAGWGARTRTSERATTQALDKGPGLTTKTADGSGTHESPGQFILVDYPGATQAHLLLALKLPDAVAADPLTGNVLVRALRTRLMDNLRGSKGWSYEVYPFGLSVRRGGALLRLNIPLQTDKTAEAIAEIRAEIKRLRDERVPNDLLDAVKVYTEGGEITDALSSLERLNELLLEIARNDRSLNYYAEALRRLPKLTPEELNEAARAMLGPDQLVWIIAGDLASIRRELQEAGIDRFHVAGSGETH